MKKRIAQLLFLLITYQINAQAVKNKSYQFMLSTLLSHSVPEVSVDEAKAQLESIIWLDAREQNEYEISKISGALWVGYNHFSTEAISKLPRDKMIVVYCSVGYRSEKVAEKLIDAGYTNVSNLYGGIFEWKNQGNQVVDDTNQNTEKVHAYDSIWGIWLKNGKKVY